MQIGERIRKLRTDANMTQDDLAAKLMVTRTAVSKWETGRGWPGVDSLKLIADEFGCTIDSLVSDDDVESKRDAEDRQSLRLYFAAMACAVAGVIAAVLAAATEVGGVFSLPPVAATVCRWVAVWGMIGYVMLSFAFSRASERMGFRRVLVSRIVVVVVVLVVMMGFVGMAGAAESDAGQMIAGQEAFAMWPLAIRQRRLAPCLHAPLTPGLCGNGRRDAGCGRR